MEPAIRAQLLPRLAKVERRPEAVLTRVIGKSIEIVNTMTRVEDRLEGVDAVVVVGNKVSAVVPAHLGDDVEVRQMRDSSPQGTLP